MVKRLTCVFSIGWKISKAVKKFHCYYISCFFNIEGKKRQGKPTETPKKKQAKSALQVK